MSRKEIKKNDRRTRYSKNAIREAYLELLNSKPPEKISVTELCKTADINRGTFYLHYETVKSVQVELEDEIYEEIIDFLHKSLSDESNRQNLSDTFYETKLKNNKYIRLKMSHRINEKICSYAQNLMTSLCLKTGQLEDWQAELFSIFTVNACYAMSKRWFENDLIDLKKESAFVNKMINAIYCVTVDPHELNEAFNATIGNS